MIRVGVVHEYIFDTGQLSSVELLKNLLTRFMVPSLQGLSLNVKLLEEGKNILVTLESVRASRQTLAPDQWPTAQPEWVGYGIRVKVDVNNADTRQTLTDERIAGVLSFADQFDANRRHQPLHRHTPREVYFRRS